LWEIAIKTSLGKLGVPADFLDGVVRAGFDLLTINTEHIRVLGNLPHHHRDPFDRLLVAQAIAERVTLLTADTQIMRYDVKHL
jgi:PIN domain nuclease of toxin-antitoxin system